MTNTDYDVLVLGAGPAGENAADLAARTGLRVGIVERELVGGECSYWGCMPSKALLRPGEALREISRVPGARGAVTGKIDIAEALARRDALAGNWDDTGQVDWLTGVGVDLVRGHGRLAGDRRVEVESSSGERTTYEVSTAVVIATGSRAFTPPVDGLRDIEIWDNRHITEAKDVPRRLLILGGGVIGVEMAQAFKDLGSEEVTIVEMLDHLVPREEPEASAALEKSLRGLGIDVRTGTAAVGAERDGADGPVRLRLDDGSTVEGDELLVAVGRRPTTWDIGLETVGLEPGGYIDVDDHMVATGVTGEWLYVVGDSNGRALLTHTGKYQARVAGARIAGNIETTAWSDRTATPRVVFTTPTIAAVGYTEATAAEAGLSTRVINYDLGWTAGAAALGKRMGGPAKWIVDADREVLIGATFVGPMAAEMLHSATIAIVGEVPLAKLWHAIPAFPTLSEIWLRFLEAYRDEYEVVFV